MTARLDIAVCGCGPAGLAAALLLARVGHRVRVFERFDTPRPIGSGLILQPTGLAVLGELGVVDKIAALGARIERLHGKVMPSRRVVLDVRYRALGSGWSALAVHRAALFSVLHEAAAAASIEIVTDHTIERAESSNGACVLYGARDRRIGSFDLVVDALGANSPLAAHRAEKTQLVYGALWANVAWPVAGFDSNTLEQRYRFARHMAGLLPIGRRAIGTTQEAAFFWSLKREHVSECRAESVSALKAEVCALWPELEPVLAAIDAHEQLTFAQYDHFTLAKPHLDRIVHIGDAAHATSPQLGQGANMALLDAFAFACALEHNSEIGAALSEYARSRYWHVRLFQWASAMFTPFYQSDSVVLPWIRDRLTAPVSRLRGPDALLARLVSGMTVAPIRGSGLKPLRLG